MKGNWKVTQNCICGVYAYAVYRLRDVYTTDHSGNREYGSDYFEGEDGKAQAQIIADRLNAKN